MRPPNPGELQELVHTIAERIGRSLERSGLDLAPAAQRGTAFGLYHMLAGLLVLPGALLFGAVWEVFGVTAAFLAAAGLTAAAVVTLIAIAAEPAAGYARGERN